MTTRDGGDAVVTYHRIRGLILGRGSKAVPGLGFESPPRIRGLILQLVALVMVHLVTSNPRLELED